MESAGDSSGTAAAGAAAGAGRDAAGDAVAPAGKPAGNPPPADANWAICCSGGGIRSASFCLGALQRLEASGLLAKAKMITSVSGGSYITASRAVVAHGLTLGAAPGGRPGNGTGGKRTGGKRAGGKEAGGTGAGADPAYAPGTPEEEHLRDNTHYLAPDPTIALLGILSVLVGVVVTFVLVATPLFAAAHAWGWLLRGQGILCPGSAPGCTAPGKWTASATAWWWWLAPAVLAGLALAAFVRWWLALVPGRRGRPNRSQRLASLVGWAVVIATTVAVAMLAVPPLVAWMTQIAPGPFRSLADDLGFTAGRAWTPAPLAGVFTAVAAVSASVRGKLQQWHVMAAQGQASARSPAARPATAATPNPGLLGQIGGMIRTYVLPWLASAVVVLALVVAGLRWVRDGVATGYSPSVSWLVSVPLVLMLILRLLVDVNRISVHDFYRWRLATAYAVMRRLPGEDRGQARRARRGVDTTGVRAVPGFCLSDLAGQEPVPVFCTTANINAEREVPVGRDGLSLTFDPKEVILRGEGPGARVTARTTDYEALVGRQRLALFDVSAISGAAISPLMGAATRQAYRILLTATNVRLGVWMPHPKVVADARGELDLQCASKHRRDRWPTALRLALWYMLPHPRWRKKRRNSKQSKSERSEARLWAYLLRLRSGKSRPSQFWGGQLYRLLQPTLGLLWAEAAGHTSYRSTWICVSDGGHYDNLGLVEALSRGASNILVLDASGDKVSTWYTLGGTIAQARDDAGVDITLDPTVMCPSPLPHAGEVRQPWAKGTFARIEGWPARPGGPAPALSGTIWVVKLGWWRGVPWDVQAYAEGHSTFPTDPTLYQLFSDAEFDAYRELGASAADLAVKAGLGTVKADLGPVRTGLRTVKTGLGTVKAGLCTVTESLRK